MMLTNESTVFFFFFECNFLRDRLDACTDHDKMNQKGTRKATAGTGRVTATKANTVMITVSVKAATEAGKIR